MEGRLEQLEGGLWQIRFVRLLSHPVDKVWRALVEPEHMAAWMPARMEGERRAGAPLRFVFADDPSYESLGEIRIFDPPRLLELTWEDEVLRWELRDTGGGCELTFITRFSEVGKAARDAAGWHVCLDALEAHLAGTAPDGTSGERWRPLNRRYRTLFGPEASVIGPPEWHPEAGDDAQPPAHPREHSLTVHRRYDAPVEAVYAAWTEPELMRRWMGERVEADPRPGGAYRIELRQDGTGYVQAGEYLSLEPARRVVQTFRVETTGENPFRDEIVELLLRPAAGATELVLIERWNGPALSSDEERDASHSWSEWLGRMESVLRQTTR